MDILAASALDWWEEAGVDSFVDEIPRDWLATPRPHAARPNVAGPDVTRQIAPATIAIDEKSATRPAAIAPPPPLDMPDDLAAFRAWLLAERAIPGRPAARFDAQGDPLSGTMILLDMPEIEDRAAGHLLSGKPGALLDRMLAAMGLSRETAYLAPFSPARPASGTLDAVTIAALLPALRHHLALVRPRRLLLMGEAPVRALLGLGGNAARGRAHPIDIAGTPVPAIASFAPRFVLQAAAPEDLKARRAMVWADLQLFMAL